MIKLKDSVFFREYDNKTYITDIHTHREYMLDVPVFAILDLFKEKTSPSQAKNYLSRQYPQVDYCTISDDIDSVVDFLTLNGLIEGVEINTDISIKGGSSGIQKYTILNKIFYTAMLELTYRCCEKCKHCYLEPSAYGSVYEERAKNEMATEKIKSVIDEISQMNAAEVTITGGEPFIRKDCLEILDYISKKGLLINIFSNAILLSEKDIHKISKLNIKYFHVSLYSHIPEKHDNITGVKGSFYKTINAVKTFSKYNVAVNIKFVLMEENKDDFDGVAELAKEMNASIQLISFITPSIQGDCALSELTVKDREKMKEVIYKWDKLTCYNGYNGEFSETHPICEAGMNNLSINPYGKVYPCNSFKMEVGDIYKQTLSEIWETSEKLKEWQNTTRAKLVNCVECTYNAFCEFCPGVAFQFSGNMFQKYNYACENAKARWELYGGN